MNEAEKLGGWQDYTELAKMLKALADGVRLNIVRVLAQAEEVNVTDLVQALLVSQPLVSWHLAALRRHGLVKTRRQGRQVYCRLDRTRFRYCQHLLDDVVSGAPVPGVQPGGAVPHSNGNAPTTPTSRAKSRSVGQA